MPQLAEQDVDAPKWRRQPEKRPNDILDGALIEFRERGFSGARIEDIAKHAGLSKGSVYLYFSSKEDMLKALVRRSISPIADELKNISDHIHDECSQEPASDVLKRMLLIVGERFMDKNVRTIPLLIIGEAGNFPEHAAFYREEVIEIAMGAISTVITSGIEAGEFKDVNVTYAIRTLVSVLIMQIIWSGVFARDDDPDISIKDLLETHLDIYLNGIIMPKET